MNIRSFYAEFCPRGIKTISAYDELMQFDSREERDEMVNRINESHWEGDCAQAVTTREVAHRYDLRKFHDADYCTESHERTCAGKHFSSIRHRPNYRF